MKKSIAVMLVAMMQSAFATQLMDGKYINFEEFVRSNNKQVVNASFKVSGSCKTVDQYKTTCVNGTNSTRRYFTNAMLQEAFAEARNLKGIGVYLPPGVWNFNEQIVVPHGMTLKGSYDRPHNVTESDLYAQAYVNQAKVTWNRTDGTNIACYHGWGWNPANYKDGWDQRDAGACIALRGTATLDGVNVFYPQQAIPSASDDFNPVPYPWTISCQTGVGNFVHDDPYEGGDYISRCAIMNTTLVNSYAGIDLSGSNDHYIKGVNMTALKRGIRIDAITSQGAIEDVNIHTQFCTSYYGLMGVYAGEPTATKMYNDVESYILNNMVGMEFGRVDWGWISNVFIFKANKGFYFRRGYNGDKEYRAVPSVDIQNSGCDLCVDAVYAEEINSGIGVNFTNSNLLGRIYSGPNNYGPIRILNSHLSFQAGLYGAYKKNNTNFYNRNHVDVGAHTTMQISNSEILDFIEDPIGLWYGASFNVEGNLLLSNSTLAWPNLTGFNFASGTVNGVSVSPVVHFRTRSNNTNLLTNNLLIRGSEKLRVIKYGNAKIDTAHTAYDRLSSGYHPQGR